MWDLSSLTRDQTCSPCNGRWSLNHWTIREAPRCTFFKSKFRWNTKYGLEISMNSRCIFPEGNKEEMPVHWKDQPQWAPQTQPCGVSMSTLRSPHWNEPVTPGEVSASRTGAGGGQNEPGASRHPRCKSVKTKEAVLTGHWGQTEEALTGQTRGSRTAWWTHQMRGSRCHNNSCGSEHSKHVKVLGSL